MSTTPCIRPLTCPVCRVPLRREPGVLRCAQGHSFDVAREGYVNLLLSRKKLAATVGDDAAMLQARRRFLESGAYAPLAAAICEAAAACLAERVGETAVLDAGCGEGYYIGRLRQHLSQQNYPVPCLLGLDVAKRAAKMAARHYPQVQFFVADLKQHVPCADHSLDLLLNVFAPRHPAEFARTLRGGGHLLVVIPGSAHLRRLREAYGLLDIEPEKEARLQAQLAPDFQQAATRELKIPLTLSAQQGQNLIGMMPSARHLDPVQEAAIREAEGFVETAVFRLLLFRKISQ